jgi:outer membrane protein
MEEQNKTQEMNQEKCVNLKPLYIINIVLAIAVVALFLLHFLPSSQGNKTLPEGAGMNIAFVNTDTVFENYQFVNDKKDHLRSKTTELQTELEKQENNFKYQLNDYQNKIKSNQISIEQAKRTEENLGQMQQNLMQLEQEYSNQLAQMEYDIQLELIERLVDYLKEYNEEAKWDYILSYTYGGGILITNPEADLTNEVLAELNDRYSKEDKNEEVQNTENEEE